MADAARAVVLLSGGLDSATVLAMARAEGYEAHALSFRYGQRHGVELLAAGRVAAQLGAASHEIVDLDLGLYRGSALTGDVAVPKGRTDEEIGEGVPVTYVPARNLVFLSIAAGYAETIGARDVFVGVNAVDYSGYPDCRPAFIEAFARAANLATAVGIEAGARGEAALRVRTPLMDLTKGEIIAQGVAAGVDFGLTVSCYDPDGEGRACGACDSCSLRRAGFASAGVEDPTRYVG